MPFLNSPWARPTERASSGDWLSDPKISLLRLRGWVGRSPGHGRFVDIGEGDLADVVFRLYGVPVRTRSIAVTQDSLRDRSG